MATAVVEERELLKTISWFDGFVGALANPSFLITGLGGSALSLGGWGAVILWTVSVIFGALHNYIYSETATMFPKLSGGIAIYAHEAWKRYFSFVGPVAAFGYWIGWSVVLSATGVVVGFLVPARGVGVALSPRRRRRLPGAGAVLPLVRHVGFLDGRPPPLPGDPVLLVV